MVLDGQIVVTDKQGKPDFEAMMEMMERYMSRRSHHMVQYSVFDVIYHKGKKVTQLLPLVERKELVDAILKPTEAITKVQWMYGRGTDYFNLIKEQGLEGIVLKKADAKYQINKRSNDWLKVIHYQYADAIVTGIRKRRIRFTSWIRRRREDKTGSGHGVYKSRCKEMVIRFLPGLYP
jgi:DNA ligase 1